MFATLKAILIKLFLSIIILSFIIWGIGDIVKSMNHNYVAKIGNRVISTEEFKSQIIKEKEYLQRAYGSEVTDRHLRQMGFDRYIINKMIQKNLLYKAAQDFGFKLSDEKIAELIKKDPIFHDKNGNFDKVKFENFLKYNRFSERELSNKVNEQYITKILVDLISSKEFEIKDYEKILSQYYGHKRNVELFKINLDDLQVSQLSNEELNKFYEENSNLFMMQEKRDFKIATLSPKLLEPKIIISEEELKQAYEDRTYDDNKKSYEEMKSGLHKKLVAKKLEEQVDAIKTEIEDLLAGDSTVEQIAEKFELKLSKHNDISAENLRNTLGQGYLKIFEMGLDNPKEIFYDQINDQYLIVELSQIVIPKAKDFSEVKNEVIDLVTKKLKKDLIQNIRTEIVQNYQKMPTHTKELIAKYKLSTQTLSLTRDGLNAPANIPSSLIEELFSINKNEFCAINSMDNKNYYFALVKDIVIPEDKADEKQLANLKEQLRNSYKGEFLDQYIEYLRKHYKVKINYELINHLFNQ